MMQSNGALQFWFIRLDKWVQSKREMLRTKEWAQRTSRPKKKKMYWLGKVDDCESGRKTRELEDYSATCGMGTVRFPWSQVSFLRTFVFVLGH